MFWRKQRAAIERFHPLHQSLIHDRGLSASLRPAEWAQLIGSLAGHPAAVRRGKWRLPDRTGSVMVPLIRVLSEDMRPDAVLSIAADLRGAKVQVKMTPEVEVPNVRRLRGVRKIFEARAYDPWLRMRAELRDGSVLELTAADKVRYRRVHKVNPRGKHKVKRKTKTTHVISVTRRLPADAVPQRPSAAPPPWIRVKVRPGRRTMIRTSAKLQAMRDETMLDRILQLSAEPFRWTPPGPSRHTA